MVYKTQLHQIGVRATVSYCGDCYDRMSFFCDVNNKRLSYIIYCK